MTTYVIAYDTGDGLSAPVLAIAERETAFVALEFLRASGSSCFELFEVPEWPNAPSPWWNTKPIEKES